MYSCGKTSCLRIAVKKKTCLCIAVKKCSCIHTLLMHSWGNKTYLVYVQRVPKRINSYI